MWLMPRSREAKDRPRRDRGSSAGRACPRDRRGVRAPYSPGHRTRAGSGSAGRTPDPDPPVRQGRGDVVRAAVQRERREASSAGPQSAAGSRPWRGPRAGRCCPGRRWRGTGRPGEEVKDAAGLEGPTSSRQPGSGCPGRRPAMMRSWLAAAMQPPSGASRSGRRPGPRGRAGSRPAGRSERR